MAAMTRTQYAALSNDELKRRFLSALDRSQRADTSEAYLADEFAMQETWAVLEERGQPHPYVKNARSTACEDLGLIP